MNEIPESVLVFSAHPDDVDFGAAGTVATFTNEGTRVAYCIATDGDAGGFDRSIERRDVAEIRQQEQREAARIAGVDEVEFLHRRDGELVADLELRCAFARAIRIHRPSLVICPSPERNFARIPASHPDHLAVGEAALCAVYPDARNPFAFPELLDEGLEPYSVAKVWIVGHASADVFIDVTETFERKLAAILAHKSQHPDPARVEPMVRRWLTENAVHAGLGETRLAEAFFGVALPT